MTPVHLDRVAAIRAALRADERLAQMSLRRLEVECERGVVSLFGEVPDVATKKLVASIAATVPGVAWVEDRVSVRPTCQASDEAIRVAVSARFAHDAELRAVVVTVDDGVVSLLGEVRNGTARCLAGALAWSAAGCRDVQNWLSVTQECDDDVSQREAIRRLLRRNSFIDAEDIDVQCEDGVVTLTGSVASAVARSLAESEAWLVEGVVAVKNEIAVGSPVRAIRDNGRSRRARRGSCRRARAGCFVPPRRYNSRSVCGRARAG